MGGAPVEPPVEPRSVPPHGCNCDVTELSTEASSAQLSWPGASARIVVGGERKGRCRADFDWLTWLQIETSLSSGNFCGGDFARCAASALSLYGHASSFLCYYPLHAR